MTNIVESYVRPDDAALPDRPAPVRTRGVIGWLRAHLFPDLFNGSLTILALLLLYVSLPPALDWMLISATWIGDAASCGREAEGACWAFIADKFRVLMVGVYPGEESWRALGAAILLGGFVLATVREWLTGYRLVLGWLCLPVAAYILIGGGLGLNPVDQSLWGGLMLSMLLAVVGIILSIPLGIMLALGRYSGPPMIRALCTGVIETVRGVPLITILFMASVMMPLFLPPDFLINNMMRIQIGVILFSAAYIAEVVRGGLQALPKGQYEAAEALGLNYWQMTYFIIVPQALRHVLPSLIGRCIALFKDTSLVIIVGLLDFLGMLKSAAQDPEWLGFEAESYVFGALVYWAICFSMSRYGALLEKRGPKSQH